MVKFLLPTFLSAREGDTWILEGIPGITDAGLSKSECGVIFLRSVT